MVEVNYQLFRIELDTIPIFNGETSGINLFCNACDKLVEKYSHNAEVKNIIFQTILGKLRDRAKTLICSRNELNTWARVKAAIYSYFADKRDFGQLVQEFNNTRIYPKEDTIAFGHRIQDLLSKLNTKLAQTRDIEHKAERAEIYAQTALEIYLVNLPEDIQVHVKPLGPDSLEEAIGLVQDAENFKARSNLVKGIKPSMPQNQQHKRPNIPPVKYVPFNPPQKPNSMQYSNNYRFTSPPPNAFPTGPIYNFPRPNTFQKQNFPTNKQVFGPPRNVWATGQASSSSLPKPVPMSGISTAIAKPINYSEVHNTEVQNFEEPQPIYNDENGLWYMPIEPQQQQTNEEFTTEENEYVDDENFHLHASSENSTN